MSMCETLAAELQQEAKTTRRLLERVPEGSFDWKPHDRSMSLGRLAGHVAELPSLIAPALTQDELDFATGSYQPFFRSSTAELLEKFDQNINAAVGLLSMAEPIAIRSRMADARHATWRLRGRGTSMEVSRAIDEEVVSPPGLATGPPLRIPTVAS